MVRLLRLTGTVLLGLFLSAPGCEGPGTHPEEDASLVASRDSIRKEFTAEGLGDSSLRAFERKARLGLSEFADYYNISADTSLDPAFRTEARQMIPGLFLPGEVNFLDKFDKDHLPCRIMFDSIMVVEPLRFIGDGEYRGMIRAYRTTMVSTGMDTVVKGPEVIRAEIVVARTAKAFGADTLHIWKVFLGKMLPAL